MRKKVSCKRILVLLFAMMMLSPVLPISASSTVQVDTMVLEFQGEDTVVLKEVLNKSNQTNQTVVYDSVKHLVVAEGVKELPACMFERFMNVETIVLPASLTNYESGKEILDDDYDEWKFYNYSYSNSPILNCLKSITISDKNKDFKSIDGILYSKDEKSIIEYPKAKTNPIYTVPNTVKDVNIENSYMKELILGENVSQVSVKKIPSLQIISVHQNNQIFTSIDGVLFSKDKKKLIAYPAEHGEDYTVPTGTQVIEGYAFTNTYINKIKLPDSLLSIKSRAFEKTQMKSITLPKNVENFSLQAFIDSPITHVHVDSENLNYSSVKGILYNKDMTEMIYWPEARKETTLSFPKPLKGLDLSMVKNIEDATTLVINSDLKYIINTEKNQLKRVVNRLENANFVLHQGVLYSSDLKELVLYPNQNPITKIVMPGTVTNIDNAMFISENTTTSITLPKNLETISSVQRIPEKEYGRYEYLSLGFHQLGEVLISEENQYFQSIDGILYSKDQTILQWYPQNHENEVYTIPDTVTKSEYMQLIGVNNLVELKIPKEFTLTELIEYISAECSYVQFVPGSLCLNLEKINVDKENQVLYSEDGVLFADTSLLLYPPAKKDKRFVVPKSIHVMNSYSHNMYLEELVFSEQLNQVYDQDPNGFVKSYDAFVNFSALKEFVVPKKNARFKVVDGGLYDNQNKLISYPVQREAEVLQIASDVYFIYCIENLKRSSALKRIETKENKYLKSINGNLYTYWGEPYVEILPEDVE